MAVSTVSRCGGVIEGFDGAIEGSTEHIGFDGVIEGAVVSQKASAVS